MEEWWPATCITAWNQKHKRLMRSKQDSKLKSSNRENFKGITLVLLGAFSWGTLPIFSRIAYNNGSTPILAASWRSYIATVVFFIWFLANGSLKKLRWKDIPFYLALGVCAVGGTFILYMKAVELLPTAMAAVLLYTAPAFVIILNRILFKIPITKSKLAALLCSLIGCTLVTKAYDVSALSGNWKGILIGLSSGLTYSLTTVVGARKSERFNGTENAGFMVMFSAVIFLFVSPPWNLSFPSGKLWIAYLGLAIIGSVLAYVFYLKGLDTGIDGGVACIIATTEPVIATILGVLIYGDNLAILQIIGIVIVIIGISLTQRIDSRDLGKKENN